MLKNIRYIIITIVFILCSAIFGFGTLYKNLRPLASNTNTTFSAIKEANVSHGEKIINMLEAVIKDTNDLYNKNLSGKRFFVEIYGATQLLLDKRIIKDSQVGYVLKDNNNMLHFTGYMMDTSIEANMLKEIDLYMHSINTPFIFVSSLSKDVENITKFKKGIDIYAKSNQNRRLFFNSLENSDVDYIDLNNLNCPLDKNNMFFKTDHHWKTETAFWAYTEIINYINNNYFSNAIDTAITNDIENYKKIELKQSFLGSLGKRMGRIYSGIDDYTYYVPNFDTDYSIYEGFTKILVSQGKFEDTIISKQLSDPNMPINSNRYGTYFGMDRGFQTIINNNCKNNKKVLIIKDSYGLPVSAFLSLNFKEVSMIDLRLVKNNSAKEFIEKGDYDLVIMNYGVGSIASEKMFKLN